MKQNNDTIDYLLAAKVAGNLDPSELREIDILIAKHNAIHERWYKLINSLPPRSIELSFKEMDNPDIWANLVHLLKRSRRRNWYRVR